MFSLKATMRSHRARAGATWWLACLTTAGTLGIASCAPPDDNVDRGRESANATRTPRVESRLLVSGEWLADRLDSPAVVVLHVGPDAAAYDRGHVPGARFLPLRAIVAETDGSANELPPVPRLDSVFEAVGVSDDARVILYGPPLAATRAFVTLDYLGHGGDAALLNGGLERWKAEGRPLSTEAVGLDRTSFTPRPQPERIVDARWIARHLGDPEVVLLDVRPEAQFTGAEAGGGVPRPGHIPGATNLYWEEMLVSAEQPVLEDPETLRGMFRDAGVDPGDTVVTYCRTGMQSSFAYFVARYLGYDARLYDGSFMDWSRREGLPVER